MAFERGSVRTYSLELCSDRRLVPQLTSAADTWSLLTAAAVLLWCNDFYSFGSVLAGVG